MIELPLGTAQIQEIIPHRYPFLMIDKVVEFVDGERIVGIKNVSSNEPFFQGHFPGRPVMPGVLIIEALAQLGVIYAKLIDGGVPSNKLCVFSGVDAVRFRRQVFPGDVLRLELSSVKRKLVHWKMEAEAYVGEEKAVSGVIKATEID